MPPKGGKKSPAGGSSGADGELSGNGLSTGGASDGKGVCLVLTFPNMTTMADGLARVSAYLEDPSYEGEALSLYRAKSLNIPAKRYAGHNFPATAYVEALGALGQLSTTETLVQRALNESFKRYKDRSLVYVIAHSANDLKTLEHEKHHASFYFCPEYRKRVEGIWGSVEKGWSSWAEQFNVHLSDKYCKRVWLDEFQAIVLNREYECATKVVNLLQSVVPPPSTLPYTCVNVQLPPLPTVSPLGIGAEGGGSAGAEEDGEVGGEIKSVSYDDYNSYEGYAEGSEQPTEEPETVDASSNSNPVPSSTNSSSTQTRHSEQGEDQDSPEGGSSSSAKAKEKKEKKGSRKKDKKEKKEKKPT